MANPFEEDEDWEILEGFLCPICKTDLKDIESLTSHFEISHKDADKDLVQSFKDIFSMAKKKILNFDENELSKTLNNSLQMISGNNNQENFVVETPQLIGQVCDHFSYFRELRNPRLERYATETNKLIIRLNKLLTNRPKDPEKIKDHEKNVSLRTRNV